MFHELNSRNIKAEKQVALPVKYNDIVIESGYRVDLLVEGEIIVEIKAVDNLLTVHKSQLLTYLKLAEKRLGLLINFNVPLIKSGIKRVIL